MTAQEYEDCPGIDGGGCIGLKSGKSKGRMYKGKELCSYCKKSKEDNPFHSTSLKKNQTNNDCSFHYARLKQIIEEIDDENEPIRPTIYHKLLDLLFEMEPS